MDRDANSAIDALSKELGKVLDEVQATAIADGQSNAAKARNFIALVAVVVLAFGFAISFVVIRRHHDIDINACIGKCFVNFRTTRKATGGK